LSTAVVAVVKGRKIIVSEEQDLALDPRKQQVIEATRTHQKTGKSGELKRTMAIPAMKGNKRLPTASLWAKTVQFALDDLNTHYPTTTTNNNKTHEPDLPTNNGTRTNLSVSTLTKLETTLPTPNWTNGAI
jgi:hypothetical protein